MRSLTLRRLLLGLLAVTFVVAIAAGALAVAAAGFSVIEGELPGWPALLGTGVVLALVFTVSDLVLRRALTEPVERMARDATAIADGDYERQVRVTGAPEVRRLGRVISELADRLLEEREVLAENIRSLEETNRALTDTRDELVHAEKMASVGRMAAGLAHEVGNPLNAIMSYAEVGRRRGVDAEWLEGIQEEARRIDRIVQGLLDYARPGEGAAAWQPVDELARETVDLLEAQGRLDGIRVAVETSDDPLRVWASRVHLQQVLMNLLLNALDAVEESERPRDDREVVIHTALEEYRGIQKTQHRPRRSDDPEEVDYSHLRRFQSSPGPMEDHELAAGDPVVVIEVVDNGSGLEVDDPQMLFDPFFTTKEPGQGTGLGLAVSARLVSRMGGLIEAEERRDGPGSRFCILLPHRTESPEEEDR